MIARPCHCAFHSEAFYLVGMMQKLVRGCEKDRLMLIYGCFFSSAVIKQVALRQLSPPTPPPTPLHHHHLSSPLWLELSLPAHPHPATQASLFARLLPIFQMKAIKPVGSATWMIHCIQMGPFVFPSLLCLLQDSSPPMHHLLTCSSLKSLPY